MNMGGIVECTELGPTCVLDWGTIVGALIGVATVVVAVLAWQTSKRATEIAQRVAQAAEDEQKRVREAHARIIGRLLLHEVSALPVRLSVLEKRLASAIDGDSGGGALKLLHASGELTIPLLPNAERVEDRIHTLPDLIGADLATMISHARDLVDAANRIKSAIVTHEARAIGTRTTYSYEGNPTKPSLLLDHLRYVSTLAPSFVREFRQFVLPGITEDDIRE